MLRRQLWVNLASYRTLAVTVKGPYSAVPLAQAGAVEELLFASATARSSNPHRALLTRMMQGRMEAWYLAGANAVCAEAPEAAVTAGR